MQTVLMEPETEMQAADSKLLSVRVNKIKTLADGIKSFELLGENLPEFTAGSHIDVHVQSGVIRQYSLCNDPRDKNRYVIAILREEHGKGGSKHIHDHINEGDTLYVSKPRNFFALNSNASKHTFVAGGIGVTPLISMLQEAEHRGDAYHLHYFVRSPERAAFVDSLEASIQAGKVSVYYDSEGSCPSLDALFSDFEVNEQLYYCGPTGFMDAMARATEHWPAGTVKYELFTAPVADETAEQAVNTEFQVHLARSNKTYTVNANESIVDALAKHDVIIDISCTEGYCGTCMTRYLEGEPDHRDTVLDDSGRENYLMVCCSRSKSDVLVLDI